jgi:hypothetical protein
MPKNLDRKTHEALYSYPLNTDFAETERMFLIQQKIETCSKLG